MRISYRKLEAQFEALDLSEDEFSDVELSPQGSFLENLAKEMIQSRQATQFYKTIPLITYSDNSETEMETETETETEEENDADQAAKLITYFDNVIGSTMDAHKAKVDHLVELERQRIQREKDEAERIRREEEARIRREREEAERKAREDAERKLKEEEEAKKRKLEAERKAKEEAERKKAKEEQEAKLALEKKAKEQEEKEKRAAGSITFHKKQCEETFNKYKAEILRIKKEVVEPLKGKADLKKMVNAHKRKMNPKFGQLTNSQEQLTRITTELHQLLLEGKVDSFVYNWLLNFIAKAFISQAETEVSIKPKMAIPLAKMALNLLILHPDLYEYLMARFVKKCPLVIGYTCAIDTEEGRSNMGWKRNSENKYEDNVQYGERLGGIMTLFAVMTRLSLDQTFVGYDPNTMKHPLPIHHSWTLLARIMDTMPSLITESHFAIIGAWWDACATDLGLAYGVQAKKLLQLVSTKWVLLGKQCASRERLKMLGDDWRAGKVNPLPLMEP